MYKPSGKQYKLKAPTNGRSYSFWFEIASKMLANRRQDACAPLMITFQIAGYLTEFTGGRADIKLDGSPATVGAALQKLWSVHAGLRDRVLTEQGHVRPHVNVFVNSEVVRREEVLQSEISGDTEICIMPAVSGGWLW